METTTTAAKASVAILQPEKEKKLKMMVCIDDSEESFYALKWSLDNLYCIAGLTAGPSQDGSDGCKLTIVHVQHPFQHFLFPAGPGAATSYATPSMVESVRKAQEENSAALLSRALQMCYHKLVKAETLILEGDPKDMICQAAEQMHIDLLVLGSRGLGKIKRAFLGSVSDYCAHHAVCPITIVKPPKGQTKKE
ncbi:universal stress protein A-like protein [Mangifera indica]|uniref:universal stress protein A-like protein n=1 Tax=Mangifera indica TaxID=29780 RepID=UPI001CFB9862|nr:universal stress protein A-like protein [Mangifera indica]